MKKTRQDAWTEEEDIYLAETILYHISVGRTQLEAFKRAAEDLSRTPSACGYRWNAEVRHQYLDEIENTKNARKIAMTSRTGDIEQNKDETIDSVIMLLERVKASGIIKESDSDNIQVITQLTEDNERLQKQIKRYEDAWREMGKLWQWIHNGEQKKK